MARRRGPWKGQIGGGSSVSIVRSFGVTAVLHRRPTHSGCHSLVVRSRVGAHSICRVGSSRQDVSSSGWWWLMRARRGQQRRIGWSGAGGGWLWKFLVSWDASGTAHGTWCVCPSCSNLCWPSCVHCCLHVGHAGWAWWATCCMAQQRWVGWLQAGQSYGAFGPMASHASRWMSCKQIAHVVGSAAAVVAAGGVVAPCALQCGGVSLVRSTSTGVWAMMINSWWQRFGGWQ